jgi:hypothetical protein
MSPGEQADEHLAQHLVLTDDDARHFVLQATDEGDGLFKRLANAGTFVHAGSL